MKATGKIHPITGQEIMEIEAHDICFWEKPWEELEMFEKADYCSFRKIGFLNKANEEYVSSLYYSDSHKYA